MLCGFLFGYVFHSWSYTFISFGFVLLPFVYTLRRFGFAHFSVHNVLLPFGNEFLVMGSFDSVMSSLNMLFLVPYALFSLCALCTRSFYALFLCGLFMRSFYLLFLSTLFMSSLYSLFVYALLYALFLYTFFLHLFCALFSCVVLICSFHKRLAILRMHKSYYCTQTNMADDKMCDVLKKLGLSDRRARFVEEKIPADIVCYLSMEDFLKLGLTDRNAIMSLRLECSTFGLCTPQRVVGTNEFAIPKILIENLIDNGFSLSEMSNTLFVPQRTILRHMLEYGLKIRNFSNISDDKLDSDVLALTNNYPFCRETMLRVLLKGRGIVIQWYRFRDITHHVSEVGIQSKRKGRLKRPFFKPTFPFRLNTNLVNTKGTNHLRMLTLTINLSSGT